MSESVGTREDGVVMDTAERQTARVQHAKDAGHARTERRELAYAVDWCATCGTYWPCPEMAQAIEWRP